MKKNVIILSLILIITVSLTALVVGWHKIFDASGNPNLIACENHIDADYSLACDKCGFIFSSLYDLKLSSFEESCQDGTRINVNGILPSDAVLSVTKMENQPSVYMYINILLLLCQEKIQLFFIFYYSSYCV